MFVALSISLNSCSTEAIQQAFSADPQASQWGNSSGLPTDLPADFPAELSYPQASLQGAQSNPDADPESPHATQQTRWTTTDNSKKVQNYYSQLLQTRGWQLSDRKLSQQQLILRAKRDQLQVRVTIPASGTVIPVDKVSVDQVSVDKGGTERPIPMTVFSIDYAQGKPLSIGQAPSPPQPGDQDFVGPVALQTSSPRPKDTHQTSEVPAALKTYVKDVQRLEVIELDDPNQPIERGTFARWLVEINNRLYQDRPTRQIRLAASRQTPAFKDVPNSHPNFAYIQGLAEAGFILSPLSGDADQVTFQPNQPLTREVLLSWKVPIDFRKILPSTTTTKVQEVWAFKDTPQISQPALSAISADHNNGDLANIRRLLGSALLLQPQQPVTQAEAAATLWFIGIAGEGYSAKDVLRAEQQNQSDTVSKSSNRSELSKEDSAPQSR